MVPMTMLDGHTVVCHVSICWVLDCESCSETVSLLETDGWELKAHGDSEHKRGV
jgi:hypothetical protein